MRLITRAASFMISPCRASSVSMFSLAAKKLTEQAPTPSIDASFLSILAAQAAQLLAEVTTDTAPLSEPQVALREQTRYVARLREWE